MLVAKKDAIDIVRETQYHQDLEQWEQNGQHGARPKLRYRYRALRTSTRDQSEPYTIEMHQH